MTLWIGIALLGGLGAVCRDVLERRTSLLVVNVLGSAALGAIGTGHALVGTAFLGAFTSFSGWALEDRRRGVLHLLLGLAAAALARGLLGP